MRRRKFWMSVAVVDRVTKEFEVAVIPPFCLFISCRFSLTYIREARSTILPKTECRFYDFPQCLRRKQRYYLKLEHKPFLSEPIEFVFIEHFPPNYRELLISSISILKLHILVLILNIMIYKMV